MLKAAREAKLRTNWTCPDAAYEDALAKYIDALLRPGQPNPFADELDRVAARMAPFGFRNSLAQVALKLTAPGVPDLYQGCEQWNFSLVDPDNRRPVDFERLAVDLEAVRSLYLDGWPGAADWRQLQAGIADGRLKHLVTWRLLQLRRAWAALFRDGAYLPLTVAGAAADHAVAYARQRADQAVLVVAARLTSTLCAGDDSRWGAAVWSDTTLRLDEQQALPAGTSRWRDWLTGREVEAGRGAAQALPLAQLFTGPHALPFAVLVPAEGGPAA
jgi:(1->4)-alpha-D-glucan 1-alpha-D-glucosylmutase